MANQKLKKCVHLFSNQVHFAFELNLEKDFASMTFLSHISMLFGLKNKERIREEYLNYIKKREKRIDNRIMYEFKKPLVFFFFKKRKRKRSLVRKFIVDSLSILSILIKFSIYIIRLPSILNANISVLCPCGKQ
jgi:hypothetical protein